MDTQSKTLVLMRHGEAENANNDYQRNLTWKGEEQTFYMAEQYQQKKLEFDLIIASAAHRTTQTAIIVQEYYDKKPQVLLSPLLYNFQFNNLQEVFSLIHPDITSLLVVGHNPGISQVANHLSNQKVYFSTAQCAILQMTRQETDTSSSKFSFAELITNSTWNCVATIAPKKQSI
jgi:phosphohistidine phosphatase